MDVEDLFEKYGETDFIKFERIPEAERKHPRRDLCAFLYLHEKFGGTGGMVAGASHDEIYLDVDYTDIEKLTEADVVYLTRCGVRLDNGSLCMFA